MLRVKDILDESDKRLRMVSKEVVFPLTKKDRETIDLMLCVVMDIYVMSNRVNISVAR